MDERTAAAAERKCIFCETGILLPGKNTEQIGETSVTVDADICNVCGEIFYSTQTVVKLQRIRREKK